MFLTQLVGKPLAMQKAVKAAACVGGPRTLIEAERSIVAVGLFTRNHVKESQVFRVDVAQN